MNWGDWALERAEWQRVLFGVPNRADLLDCIPHWPCTNVRVRVHRNHGFEAVAGATVPFAAWNGLAFEWSLSAHDDSLTIEPRSDSQIELVWIDSARLTKIAPGKFGRWLVDRLRALRSATTNPIVVAAWPLAAADREILAGAAIPGVHVADVEALAETLGARWLDARTESISGTRLSNRACLELARQIACRWLPAAILPPRKAIVADLDGTLYRGVLGEDGPMGISLTPAHRATQLALARLRGEGILLALVSRNEMTDVEALFAARVDFPLCWDDFSAIDVSWDDRSLALGRIADRLRIGVDDIVFVDDNPGELAAVAASVPVFTVYASADAAQTEAALDHVAGLFRWREATEDRLRASDLRAAPLREFELRSAASPDEYLRSLQVRLGYHVGQRHQIARVAELVAKTNQFNLSLSRMNEAQIAQRLDDRRSNVVAIELSDRLSDSGIIGAVIGSRHGETVRVEELCVSCRALGRHLEDAMLTRALLLLAGDRAPRTVVFDLRRGPRNAPARQWLARYANARVDEGIEQLEMTFDAIGAKPIPSAIRMEIVQ
jgi:FkbH-like protein